MNESNMSRAGRGYLRVVVRAAREAFPIPDALVSVYDMGTEGDNAGLLYSLRTGADGVTDLIELPAPPASLSETPGNPAPFGLYNITVRKDGYGAVENIGAPIFDGVVSTQPVQLVPLSEFETESESELRILNSPADENPLV